MMEGEMITTITTFINAVGFPIFVAVFMLFKGSKESKELRDTVTELTKSVEKQTMLIDVVLQNQKVGGTNE